MKKCTFVYSRFTVNNYPPFRREICGFLDRISGITAGSEAVWYRELTMMIQNQTSDVSAKLKEQRVVENRIGPHPVKTCLLKRDRICPSCGTADMMPAGSCYVCRNCGASNGCSWWSAATPDWDTWPWFPGVSHSNEWIASQDWFRWLRTPDCLGAVASS